MIEETNKGGKIKKYTDEGYPKNEIFVGYKGSSEETHEEFKKRLKSPPDVIFYKRKGEEFDWETNYYNLFPKEGEQKLFSNEFLDGIKVTDEELKNNYDWIGQNGQGGGMFAPYLPKTPMPDFKYKNEQD